MPEDVRRYHRPVTMDRFRGCVRCRRHARDAPLHHLAIRLGPSAGRIRGRKDIFPWRGRGLPEHGAVIGLGGGLGGGLGVGVG